MTLRIEPPPAARVELERDGGDPVLTYLGALVAATIIATIAEHQAAARLRARFLEAGEVTW